MYRIAGGFLVLWLALPAFSGDKAKLEPQLVKKIDGMHDGFQLMETIRTFAQDIEQQIDFAGRFFLNNHASRVRASSVIVKNMKSAARNHRSDVSTAKAKRSVGRE